MAKKRRGRSAAFMRSINPHLRHRRKFNKGGQLRFSMARRGGFRKKRSSRRSKMGGIGNLILGLAVGIGIVAIAHSFGLTGTIGTLMIAGVGLWGAIGMTGWKRTAGIALVTLAAAPFLYSLIVQVTSGIGLALPQNI